MEKLKRKRRLFFQFDNDYYKAFGHREYSFIRIEYNSFHGNYALLMSVLGFNFNIFYDDDDDDY